MERMTSVYRSVAKLLNEAKNAAGDRAVAASANEDFFKARGWQALAVEIDRVFRDAVAVMAAPDRPGLSDDLDETETRELARHIVAQGKEAGFKPGTIAAARKLVAPEYKLEPYDPFAKRRAILHNLGNDRWLPCAWVDYDDVDAKEADATAVTILTALNGQG